MDRADLLPRIQVTIWEDREQPHLCPIMPFLILAYEHDAFSVTPEALFRDTIGQRESVEIPFKETVLDMPLFRSQDGVTAWSHASSYAALTRLARRAGYECKVNPYCIRRGAANLLSGKYEKHELDHALIILQAQLQWLKQASFLAIANLRYSKNITIPSI